MSEDKKDYGVSFGWLPELPDHRDQPYAAMLMGFEAPLQLPPRVDLRSVLPDAYDQGQLSSCTANAIAAAFQFDRIRQGTRAFMPSRLFIYWNERVMEGQTGVDRGAYIRDGIKSLADQGVCDEALFPYDARNVFMQPAGNCYADAMKYRALNYYALNNANLNELRSCLAAGFPFVFGFTIFNSFFQADRAGGMVPMPGYESPIGGHAVLAVGYDDQRELFIIRNSWGPAKGDRGHYYMPYRYLNSSLSADFWTVRVVTQVALADSGNDTA